ncbi:hypothetical protein ROZALSC1DRAFT_30608 [Rozella allomycis CSF55]|uniref:Adenylyl-sulfate kinase n=1 Tax=Rozella allomycis (strain CSF55) TaxID=988480 RepID=A0A4P9YF97_ROZAC|nr:hypothetical protein ROZALSC1DRAFT_30608 [Rozella allomycis CSF55]
MMMDIDTETRPKGHVIWLTGLSGAGKSTLSKYLHEHFSQVGVPSYQLDGDLLRRGINNDLGFTANDRAENIRRVSHIAAYMADAGLVCIVSCISPFSKDRKFARQVCADMGVGFVEVFVSAPLEVVERRDVKGLYKKARSGVIKEFTGISSPYEVPETPEMVVETDVFNAEKCVEQIVSFLESEKII